MNNQEIIDNAPEGATHIDNNGYYLMACTNGFMEPESSGVDWDYGYASHCEVRSLADIKRVVELEKELRSLVRGIKDLGSISYDQYPDTKTAENILKEHKI
jgi:hypothetical protein